MLKAYFLTVGIIILISLMPGSIALGQEEGQRARDESVIIKEKINELKKILSEKDLGGSKKELEELQKLEKAIDADDLKAKQERIKAQGSQRTQDAIRAQQQRIKEIENKLEEPLLSPEKIKELEANFDESRLSPEKIKELEAQLDKETAYFTCRAVLEEDINMCDKIQYPDARDGCSTTFNNIYMLSQIIKNKQLTTRALDICRQLEGSPTDENCREVSRACLTGDASQLSTLPYLTGEDLAFISGDDKYCQGMAGNNLGQCRDLAIYTSAIRSGNDKRCSEIKNIALQTSCRVYFHNDKGICESLIK